MRLLIIALIVLIVGCAQPLQPISVRTREEVNANPRPEFPMDTTTSLALKQKQAAISFQSLGKQEFELAEGQVEIRKYEWEYKSRPYEIKLAFYSGSHEKYAGRERHREYELFASDPYDDIYIKELARLLNELALQTLLSTEETYELATSFVQALPYTSDNVTTGYDEYPRYPYETLYDNGGDCEDSSVLVAAILQEMGRNVVLIKLPGHMAVGVECKEPRGTYVGYEGLHYCYLETTGEGWMLGQLPQEYRGEMLQVLPIVPNPYIETTWNATYSYTPTDNWVNISVLVENKGSLQASSLKLYAALESKTPGSVWDQIESEAVDLSTDEAISYRITNLHSPTLEPFRVFVGAIADSLVANPAVGEWINLVTD
jgi:hypothetical protein